MRILLLAALFALYFTLPAAAQQRNCGTEAYIQTLKQSDAGFEQMHEQARQAVQQALKQQNNAQYLRQAASTITIPVVFHVLYYNSTQNISDEQLLSQLSILNADFRRKNADAVNTPSYFQPFAADTEIEFCLATIDPNGDPTTGITRTPTTRSSFSYSTENVKYTNRGGKDAWNSSQYLNIWVCRIDDNIIGYATPPGGPPATDGVVLDYTTIGAPPFNRFSTNYNLGRTATHEVGHWLGLNHIWGNGSTCNDSDGIADTPNQREENVGCPSGMSLSCNDSPYGDMYQNFMDYTDDACMNLFTQGQAAYMRAAISTSRATILNSLACSGTLRSDFSTTVAGDTLVVAGYAVKFSDASAGVRPTSYRWEFEGGNPATSTEKNPTVTYTRPGIYDVKLTISNGSLTSTEVKTDYVHVTVNDLVVYPNPSSDFITIEQPARILVRQVEMVNHIGQTVITAEVRDRVLRVDVRDVPAGIYFLRITSTNGTIIKKVSVVR
ncbi:M43 family zinc metalloprotease [uncultured Pontibacter sp.]|uniref:M43 family zinc metalloprotease n=1 Tax=uncultured Pontibacter sp. TaxID=453356 RepID=UPI0026355357|nr:M43 family zinc metalloprotease [uncultured Pontibacter sp.]